MKICMCVSVCGNLCETCFNGAETLERVINKTVMYFQYCLRLISSIAPFRCQDVVEFARQRGVRIMIEIDNPGHAASWCKVRLVMALTGFFSKCNY